MCACSLAQIVTLQSPPLQSRVQLTQTHTAPCISFFPGGFWCCSAAAAASGRPSGDDSVDAIRSAPNVAAAAASTQPLSRRYSRRTRRTSGSTSPPSSGHGAATAPTAAATTKPVITYGSIESIVSQVSAVARAGTAAAVVINNKKTKKTGWKRLLCSCGRLACVKLPEPPRSSRKQALQGPPPPVPVPQTSDHPRAQ